MNIQMQLCGLLIMILICVFYKSHKTLKLYSEKIFFGAMCVAMANIVLDMSSIIVIHYRTSLPKLFVEMICKTYIVTIIWVSMLALTYVLGDLFSASEHKHRTKQLCLFTLFESIVVYCLPIYIYENGKDIYTYGPSVMVVYMFALFYIISVLICICVFYKKMNRRRVYAVGLWMFIWMTAAIIQFLNNQILIVGFACAIGILILFVIMENPEANVDRKLGCFNSYALLVYLGKMYEQNQKFEVLEIKFDRTGMLDEQGLQVQSAIKNAIKRINKQADTLVFKNVNSDIVIVSKDTGKLYDIGLLVCDFINEHITLKEKAKVIYIPDCQRFNGKDDMFGFISFIHTDVVGDNEGVYTVEQSLIDKYIEQFEVQKMIEDALNEDRVEVYLQPIYSNEDKRFTSAEALARIRQRDGQLLSPGLFIPVAESSGQIIELGERVIEKVCDFLKNTDAIEYGIHYIEVNLSVIQCEMKDLADRLISIVEKYQVEPERINLEITETGSISAKNILLENMRKLIEYGFTFSLDDFGKGESNLMYVVDMPVSLVKLDYDMSKAFFNSAKAKHVVRAVVNMAHGMDLKLVAEGIETKEEIDGMYEEGIDYIQGYYYAKPLPMDKFLEYLKTSLN